MTETIPWLSSKVPYFVPSKDCARLITDLKSGGFEVRLLDGSAFEDEQSLVEALGPALSFPTYYGRNWDAFVDCAGDLAESAASPIVLVWTGADHLARADLHAFTRGVYIILSTAKGLALSEVGFQFELFLVGEWGTPAP